MLMRVKHTQTTPLLGISAKQGGNPSSMRKNYALRKSVLVLVRRPFLESSPDNTVAASETFADPSRAGSLCVNSVPSNSSDPFCK